MGRLRVRGDGRAQTYRVARRPAPRDSQGGARAPQCVSRRPRVPAAGVARAHADAFSSLLAAEADLLTPPTWIILAGELPVTAEWKRALQRRNRADVRVVDLAVVASPPLELLKGAAPKQGATAWLCMGTTCLPPIA